MNGRRRGPSPPVDLRLEGLVVKKSLTRVETTRYLVIDFVSGSISVYKKPPPKDEFSSMAARSKSVPAKFMASVGLKRSLSDDGGAGGKGQVTCESLAHISRSPRHFAAGAWVPKFTVPSTVDWKLRDVENDETMFHLILPPDFKNKDPDAELFATARVGRTMTYRRLGDLPGVESSRQGTLGSIDEDDSVVAGGVGREALGSGKRRHANTSDTDSVSSTGSKKSSMFKKTFKRAPADGQEVVYQFRVLLDGNEKFIWLQAAAELGRLCDQGAVSLAGQAVDVTKKLFMLPNLGGSRSDITALRYAEWARLIDQNKNVSRFLFDVHDTNHHFTEPQAGGEQDQLLDDAGKYNATKLVKVIPTYAYRNRKMTEKDLYYEMTTTSERWEDFRGQPVGDREEETIGSLHAEVLACHGLPKLDKLSSTDAVCYFVCGPYAFATDVIDGFLSPVWPSKSRRACIFPLFHAYQKLYVGVFDDDGPSAHDDFAGRVVIDMSRLRPNAVYDIFLPLRQYQNTYVRKPRGVIHLRLRVEWKNEKKALLSYLRLPQKTKQLGNSVTVNCADLKAFRNVVLTVQGKDVPGRYKQLVQKGLQREMKLYKLLLKTTMKEQMMDIVLYANPSLSLCIFIAWMHCVYANSMAWIPVYVVAAIIALLLRNYFTYGVNEEFNFGFAPITLPEMLKVLLYGGQGTKYIKAIKVTRQSDLTRTARTVSSQDEIDGEEENLIDDVFDGGQCFKMDGDHMEFPFSEAGRYPKKTLAEACVDANAMFTEDEEEVSKSSGNFLSLRRKAKKSAKTIPLMPKANREEDDADEEDEFGLMVKTSISPEGESINGGLGTLDSVLENEEQEDNTKEKDVKVWKRVTDPRGLPEQDATVFVKARKTLKEDLIHNKDLLHKYSQRLFDDRMYIVNEEDPGHTAGEELALNQAIGVNKYKSPIVAKIAEYIAPGLEMLKVGLSVFRSGFNLFTWRDPILTSLFFFGAVILLCVLLVFPWRLFFFVVGLGAVGPQNYVVRICGLIPKKKKKKKEDDSLNKKGKRKPASRRGSGEMKYFEFHNHCRTDQGIDVREEKSSKATSSVHRAIVPTSPLIHRRFYDWPPNPSLSKVDVYGAEEK